MTITASSLPLSLVVREQPTASALPLPLSRLMSEWGGSGDEGGTGGTDPTDPSEPTEPPEPRPALTAVSMCQAFSYQPAISVSDCKQWQTNSQFITMDYSVSRSRSVTISRCHTFNTLGFVPINHCYHSEYSESFLLSQCKQLLTSRLIAIKQCNTSPVSPTISYAICSKAEVQQAIQKIGCQTSTVQAVKQLKTCSSADTNSVNISNCHTSDVQPAVPVPCRYYPISEPPPVKPNTGACRIRPPSSQLPLMLRRRQTDTPSSKLPLTLQCWHDEPIAVIPAKDIYMIHNTITATIGGIAVNVITFDIETDMNSYCWSGSLSISPDDFAKIESKLNMPVGEEPIINVIINHHQFSIIAEKVSRTRSFVNHRHNIWGRSITARLGADYATANDTMFDKDNYASQIVNQQIANLPFTIDDWGVNDWFIPANSYSISNKTPIYVIAEIAEAVGGYVESHKYDAKLSIKKRWKVNAWELATATPDVVMPADPSIQIDDTPQPSPRYNAVLVMSDSVAHNIHRSTQGRDKIAPTINHVLYTDQTVTIPKGSAILSDSGKHNIYQIKMIWGDGVELAELGQVWQFNDLDGSWRGVVTGVKVTIGQNNDAPVVYQTVTVDRYLDS